MAFQVGADGLPVGRVEQLVRLALDLMAADDFGAVALEEFCESLEFVYGFFAVAVRLYQERETSVTGRSEPNLADSLAQNAEVFLLQLFLDAGDDFRGRHVLGGRF